MRPMEELMQGQKVVGQHSRMCLETDGCFCKAPLTSVVLKGFEIHLGKEPMRVGHRLDCCSLNSLTLMPPEDALSDVPKGMGQPGR